jgi:hypothetical protein
MLGVATRSGNKQFNDCAGDPELEWIVARDQGGQMHFLHLENGV